MLRAPHSKSPHSMVKGLTSWVGEDDAQDEVGGGLWQPFNFTLIR